LPRRIETVTPENVRIEYELAGIASRCGAAVADLLLQTLAILLVVVIITLAQMVLRLPPLGWPTGVLIVSSFLLWWGYYVFFETVWNGQTPGKRLLRLRVIKYGGSPIDLTSAAVRGLIRIVDLAAIGFIVMFFSSKNQRLGDLAAGTLVVKERSEWTGDIAQAVRDGTSRMTRWNQTPEAALVKNIELITPDQFDAVKRFVERSSELRPPTRERIAAGIARPLMRHLGIEDAPGITYTNFLAAIHARCVDERGMR
jgi:uncharacterized RDD family membrane protein YckC